MNLYCSKPSLCLGSTLSRKRIREASTARNFCNSHILLRTISKANWSNVRLSDIILLTNSCKLSTLSHLSVQPPFSRNSTIFDIFFLSSFVNFSSPVEKRLFFFLIVKPSFCSSSEKSIKFIICSTRVDTILLTIWISPIRRNTEKDRTPLESLNPLPLPDMSLGSKKTDCIFVGCLLISPRYKLAFIISPASFEFNAACNLLWNAIGAAFCSLSISSMDKLERLAIKSGFSAFCIIFPFLFPIVNKILSSSQLCKIYGCCLSSFCCRYNCRSGTLRARICFCHY